MAFSGCCQSLGGAMSVRCRDRHDVYHALLIGLSILASSLSAENPPQRDDAAIRGRVVDGRYGSGIDAAAVRLLGPRELTVQSNATGAFTLLVPGGGKAMRLEATKSGYLTGTRGQLGPNDSIGFAHRFDVAAGQRLDDVVIRLWPAGSVSGVVSDERGAPIAGASVDVLTRMYTGAGPRWQRLTVSAKTDARGQYRIERLEPGSYLIAARVIENRGAGQQVNGRVVFHPSAGSTATAVPVAVDGAEARVDVFITGPPKLVTLSGQLLGADRSMLGARVRLIALHAGAESSEYDEVHTLADDAGRFSFQGVPPGQYRVRVCQFPPSDVPLYVTSGDFRRNVVSSHSPPGQSAIAPLPDQPTWVGDMSVSIADDARELNIVVALVPGARIGGRVVFEGAPAPAAEELLKAPITVRLADGGNLGVIPQPVFGIPQSRIEADHSFRSIGLPPGQYVIDFEPSTGLLPDWRPSTITVNGRDTLGRTVTLEQDDLNGVVVTLTDKRAEISGSVRDVQGRPTWEARVIAFPEAVDDRGQYWVSAASRRIRQIVVDGQGNFRAPLPPGDYLVAAVTSLPLDWMAPAALKALTGYAQKVRVAPAVSTPISVTARSWGR